MSPANDLRIEIYIRSMTQLMGIKEVKRAVLDSIKQLEKEIQQNPDLTTPKIFSHGFMDVRLSRMSRGQ